MSISPPWRVLEEPTIIDQIPQMEKRMLTPASKWQTPLTVSTRCPNRQTELTCERRYTIKEFLKSQY